MCQNNNNLCLLQPHPCARPTNSAVEQDAASDCHGDVMVRTTVLIAPMRRAVRKQVRDGTILYKYI